MPRVIRMPSADDIAKAWEDAISRVPAKYLERVEKTTGFKDRALAGEGTFAAVMEQVIREKRRAKGLEKITDEDWKRGVREKGAARIGKGMELSKTKRRNKYEPFRAALDGLEIPEKGADPIENARNIVPKVVEALVKKKRELLGL
jgi:hypothetical protein